MLAVVKAFSHSQESGADLDFHVERLFARLEQSGETDRRCALGVVKNHLLILAPVFQIGSDELPSAWFGEERALLFRVLHLVWLPHPRKAQRAPFRSATVRDQLPE